VDAIFDPSDMVSLNVLFPRLGHYSLDGLTKKWVNKQLDDHLREQWWRRHALPGVHWDVLGHCGAAEGIILDSSWFSSQAPLHS